MNKTLFLKRFRQNIEVHLINKLKFPSSYGRCDLNLKQLGQLASLRCLFFAKTASNAEGLKLMHVNLKYPPPLYASNAYRKDKNAA